MTILNHYYIMASNIQCILCRKDLFPKNVVKDDKARELFYEHMSEAHQAFYENDFLFTACFFESNERLSLLKQRASGTVTKVEIKEDCEIYKPEEQKEFNARKGMRTVEASTKNNHQEDMTYKKEKNFSCRICPKGAVSVESLNAHMRLKHPESWYQCIHCVRKFRLSVYLEKHIKNAHSKASQEGKKKPSAMPHQCPVCNKWCTRAWTLKNHMLIHDKANHKKCEKCNTLLLTEESYLSHTKGQTSCNVCHEIKIT